MLRSRDAGTSQGLGDTQLVEISTCLRSELCELTQERKRKEEMLF